MNDRSYAVFLKRNLLYLYDANPDGASSLSRFKQLPDLVGKILSNRSPPEEDEEFCKQYVRIIVIKPNIVIPDKNRMEVPQSEASDLLAPEPEITQSQELAKENNFVDLPDGSQLLRGSKEVKEFGEFSEAIAPYMCIMAAAVGAKYSVSTWSMDVVNYVLQCGAELHKKSKIRFEEVAKLEIPKVSLGRTDFSLEVNYHYDALMKQSVIVSSLKKILKQNGEWVVIVTQEFACAVYYKNHLYYLFDCYPTNEVGLSDGPDTAGFASFSRFKDLHLLAMRIVYNKNKREDQEKLEYTRFVLSTVKVKYLTKEEKQKKRKGKRGQMDDIDEESAEEIELEQEGYIEEEETKPKKKQRRRRGRSAQSEGEEEEGEEGEGEDEEEEVKEPKNKVGYD